MTNDPMASVQHITSGEALTTLGLVHRVRIPSGGGLHPALIMVHGLDGNEDVTWIFARSATPDWLILSPRAPVPTQSGFTWYQASPLSFSAGLESLARFIDGALRTYPIDPARLVLLGFSQGTVMSFAYALSSPRPAHPIAGVAALCGFIANLNAITIPPQNGLPVVMLHGTQDERVPVAWARTARDRLREAGAAVTYEESETGHKVSASGMRTLAGWLSDRLMPPNRAG
jgi:phospholipase/carboxylesterase